MAGLEGINLSFGGGSGGSVSIKDNHFFSGNNKAAAESSRDTYFTNHPNELIKGIHAVLNPSDGSGPYLERYNGSTWDDISKAIVGKRGDKGDQPFSSVTVTMLPIGASATASVANDVLTIGIPRPASAPSVRQAVRFLGMFGTSSELSQDEPSPRVGSQAIVLTPTQNYYEFTNGSWVKGRLVGDAHDGYLGSYDTLADLESAHPTANADEIAIADKQWYVYETNTWEPLQVSHYPATDNKLQTLEQEQKKLSEELSQSVQILNNNIAQKPDGLSLTNKDNTELSDLTDLKLDGLEVVDNGDGTFTLKSSSQITVADGQGIGSHSETGNAIVLEGSQVSADPNDPNVIIIRVHAATHEGINVGDGVNASRAVQTIKFPGHQAYGTGTEASIHIECLHFATKGELDAWAAKFGSVMNYDSVAVIDDDGNGFVGWYKFNAATKKVEEYDAQGVIVGDSNGFVPKNIKTIVLGTGLTAEQAGDQEDAVLINATTTGGGMTINGSHIADLETEWPLQIDNVSQQDRLLIDPNAFESQHSNACLLELDHPMHVDSDEEATIYLSHEIVPTGEYFSLNKSERGVNVQDNSGGDTAATGGQLTRIMAAVSLYGNATSSGSVKLWVYYKDPASDLAGGILTGVDGNPMIVERHYNAGADLTAEPLIIAGAMMAKGQSPIIIKIESTIDVEINPTKTLLCVEQFANGYETSLASIEFQRRLGVEIHAEVHTFSDKEASLADELVGRSEALSNLPPNSGGDYLNYFGAQNNTKIMASISNGAFNISANGEPADYYVDIQIDNVQTQMLRGHEVIYSANFKNRNDAYNLEVYSWTGKPDGMPKVWNGWGNALPTINDGFTLVKSKFQQEQPDGLYRDVMDTATIPDNANNIVILVRPIEKVDPSDLSMKDFYWGVPHAVHGYAEVSRHPLDEMHFKFDKGYGEFYLDAQGYSEVRYTINNTPEGNPMPVGVFVKGKAPIERDATVNQVPGSQIPQFDGAIKFNKDGEARVSRTYYVWNEQLTDDTVTFFDVLIDVDGNETKIDQSEATFTAKGNQGASGTFFSIPAYSVEVETGQRIGARAKSNIKDGAYIKSDKGGQFAVQTVIEFDELIATSSDAPDLVSAPLNKSLVVDRRYHEFSGNSAQNIDITDLPIPSDVEIAIVTVKKSTSTGFNSVEAEHAYNAQTETLTVHVGGAASGTVFIEFWSK